MTVFQMNQFVASQIKGLITDFVSPFTLSVQLAAGSASVVPGDAVKLSTIAGQGSILVTKAAATDAAFGFVAFSEKKNSWAAGDALEIGLPGTIIILEAAAAITRGASVEYVVSGAKVQTASANAVQGRALDSAAGDGSLIRVLLTGQIEFSEAIDGGTINNTVIGGSVPAAGSFTTLNTTGIMTPAQLVSAVTALTPGATVALNAALGNSFTLTPGQNSNLDASSVKAGQDVYLRVLTSGVTPYNLTLNSGFGKTAGVLNTGSVSAKVFDLHFHAFADGALDEISRTTAL